MLRAQLRYVFSSLAQHDGESLQGLVRNPAIQHVRCTAIYMEIQNPLTLALQLDSSSKPMQFDLMTSE